MRSRSARLEDRLGRARVSAVVGRERELATLCAQLREDGAVVSFVHGIGGIGKSSLLGAAAPQLAALGARVLRLDGREVEPSSHGVLHALSGLLGVPGPLDVEALAEELDRDAAATVFLVDEFDHLRALDSWLRQRLLPALPERTRWVFAGRFAPRSTWASAPGWADAVLSLKLGPLGDAAARNLLSRRGVSEADWPSLLALAKGTPLALTLVTPRSGAEAASATSDSALMATLAERCCEALRPELRAALEAASLERRVTLPMLEAMLGRPSAELLSELAELSFVEYADDGLILHEVVRQPVAARLRMFEPSRHLQLRRAAWRALDDMIDGAAQTGVHAWRLMADLMFVLDHPEVREAFFASDESGLVLDDARPVDGEAILAMFARHQPPAQQAIGAAWWRLAWRSFRVARDTSGAVTGFSIVTPSRSVPAELYEVDPLLRAWQAEVDAGSGRERGALFMRSSLTAEHGEAPSDVRAALWLDVKRAYIERPGQWAYYVATRFPEQISPLCVRLGFLESEHTYSSERTLRLAFGAAGLWSWLRGLAQATELVQEQGQGDEPSLVSPAVPASSAWQLDPRSRGLLVDDTPVPLTALEFQAMEVLVERAGDVVTRDELLDRVWGERNTGSNVVDALVRLLRRKLGPYAAELETVRGHGYRVVRASRDLTSS